jgi:hypothetical protein
MSRELISKATRREFQVHLAKFTLREIDILFGDHGIAKGQPPVDVELPSGQRQSLVVHYYYSLNWSDPSDVRRILGIFSELIADFPEPPLLDSYMAQQKAKLLRLLERDGYELVNGRFAPSAGLSPQLAGVLTASSAIELSHLEEYIQRIHNGIADDPEQAIGSTKDLVEATMRTILHASGQSYQNRDDIPTLLKAVQSLLNLSPGEVDDSKDGADAVKRVLSGLGSCVLGMSDLRKHYGTGHGRRRRSGITPRHARLAAGAGAALATFLLETWDNQVTVKKA